MEFSWENFCTVVLGTLMFGCISFPCPSPTVALTRTCVALRCVCREKVVAIFSESLTMAVFDPFLDQGLVQDRTKREEKNTPQSRVEPACPKAGPFRAQGVRPNKYITDA